MRSVQICHRQSNFRIECKANPQGIFLYFPPNKTEKDWKNSVTLLSCDTAVQIDQIKKGGRHLFTKYLLLPVSFEK